jgi:hypothetical protein
MGGEALANSDDVSDWEGGERLLSAAVAALGPDDADHPTPD